MSNSIDNGPLSLVQSSALARAQSDAAGNAAAKEQGSKPSDSATTDRVDLSSRAEKLSKVAQEVAATPEVDQKKVEQVREAIQSGNFQVDKQRIADQLIASEQQLP